MGTPFGKEPAAEFEAGDRIVYTYRRLPEGEAPANPWHASLSGRHGAIVRQVGDSPTPSLYIVRIDDGPEMPAFSIELSKEA